MTNLTQTRSKIEKLGLVEEAIKLKGQGMGSVRIAKALTGIAKESVNSTNVDNFFKSFKANVSSNESLARKVDSALSVSKLSVLGQWEKLDSEFKNLLGEANKIQTRVMQTKAGPVEIKFKDLKLWNDVLCSIAKVTETRARLLGQMQSGVHIHITNIENQYNDLKQIIIDAEERFPGILNFVEGCTLQKKE